MDGIPCWSANCRMQVNFKLFMALNPEEHVEPLLLAMAVVPTKRWQKHGGWSSDIKWRYVQHNKQYRKAIGRAILHRTDLSVPAPAPIA